MKMIRYDLLQSIVEDDETGVETPITLEVEMLWSESAEALAKEEAYNGVYEIFDDGQPEPEPAPTETSVWDELDEAYQEGVDSV